MVENEIYGAPKSRVNEPEEVIMTPVKKPWPRIIIAIWMFLAFGVFANVLGSAVATLLNEGNDGSKKYALVFFAIELVLIYGVINLKKYHTISTGVIALLLGCFQVYNSISQIVLVEGGARVGITIFLFFVVPAFLTAWYLLRPSYRKLVNQNESYLKFNGMQKYAADKLRKP